MVSNSYDIIDENGQPLGSTADYDTVHKDGLWHRGVHVVLYTATDHVVVQKRSDTLKLYPGTYEISVGGGVDAGEEPISAAIREVKEELGIDLTEDDLIYIGTYRSSDIDGTLINHSFDSCYKAKISDTTVFELDANETSSAIAVSRQDLFDSLAGKKNRKFEPLAPRDELWRLLLNSL